MKGSGSPVGSLRCATVRLLISLFLPRASAEVVYVATSGLYVFPRTCRVNAATSIRAAVDAATVWTLVLVSNGAYAATGRPQPGRLQSARGSSE